MRKIIVSIIMLLSLSKVSAGDLQRMDLSESNETSGQPRVSSSFLNDKFKIQESIEQQGTRPEEIDREVNKDERIYDLEARMNQISIQLKEDMDEFNKTQSLDVRRQVFEYMKTGYLSPEVLQKHFEAINKSFLGTPSN